MTTTYLVLAPSLSQSSHMYCITLGQMLLWLQTNILGTGSIPQPIVTHVLYHIGTNVTMTTTYLVLAPSLSQSPHMYCIILGPMLLWLQTNILGTGSISQPIVTHVLYHIGTNVTMTTNQHTWYWLHPSANRHTCTVSHWDKCYYDYKPTYLVLAPSLSQSSHMYCITLDQCYYDYKPTYLVLAPSLSQSSHMYCMMSSQWELGLAQECWFVLQITNKSVTFITYKELMENVIRATTCT